MVESCSTSLPGGDQVDGLPLAASLAYSFTEVGATTDLIVNFRKFLRKVRFAQINVGLAAGGRPSTWSPPGRLKGSMNIKYIKTYST